MLANLIVGALLLAVAGVLLAWNLRSRPPATLTEDESTRESEYARTRLHRRLQIAVLVGLAGAAVIGGGCITAPILASAYWGGVVLLVCWIAVLALADLRGSQMYFQELSAEQRAEGAALRAELAKHLKEHKQGPPMNGHAK